MPIRVSSKRAAVAPPGPSTQIPFGLPAPPADFTQKPPGLSLCMIVKNEERFLEHCLRSVADVADEICIVDTGSTDRTMEIARAFGANVIEREWKNDFAWARNEALALATKRWVLMLDADEELTPDSKPALAQLKNAPAHNVGAWVRCYNESDDYRGTGAMSHSLVRMFPNSERIRFRGMIHEFVTWDGSSDGIPAVHTPIAIVHHGYLKEVVESRNKAVRNFEIVKAAAEADPTDAFTWFNVGSTAFLMGDFEAARDGFEKMREMNGETRRGFIANGYAVLSEVYADKLGDPVKGEEVARSGLRFSPHYANMHFQLGKTLIAQRRFEEARKAFEEAIEDGKYAAQQFIVDDQVYIWKSHSEIGSTYVMQGDDRSAIEWFRKGLKNAPNVQPLRLNLARALERIGQFDEARELFHGVYKDFRDGGSVVDLVNFLLRRRDANAALAIIDDAHAPLKDAMVVPLLHVAAQIAAKERPGSELRYLELAADRVPGDAEILNWLEAIYQQRGDVTSIERLRDREAATEPVKAADFLRRSYNANVAHNFAEGLTLAMRGLELDANHEHLNYNAAVAAAELGKLDLALGHLKKIVSKETPVYLPAQLLIANVLRALSRVDEAIAAVENLLAVDERNIDALVLRSQLYEVVGNVGAAEQSLRKIIELIPEQGAAHVATFLLKQGRFEEAAAVAGAALNA